MRSISSSASSTRFANSVSPSINDRRASHHCTHARSHGGNVHRQLEGWHSYHVHHSLRYVHRLVANTLEISVDLDHRKNEAQINSHRLLHGEQVDGEFVHFALGTIDSWFIG